MTIQEIIEMWNGCCSDGGSGGGSSDLSTAKVTLNLTADDDTPFVGEEANTLFNFGTSEYMALELSAIDHVLEIVMYNGEARITQINGIAEGHVLYGNIADDPICTGGVEYNDLGYFVVTGDGTITATMSAGGPK